MAVIPVGAVLLDRKLVHVARVRLDPWKRHTWNTVKLRRHQQAVPVDRAVFVQIVDHLEAHILAFAQPDQRCRHRAVDANRARRATVNHHDLTRNTQFDIGTRQRWQRRRQPS